MKAGAAIGIVIRLLLLSRAAAAEDATAPTPPPANCTLEQFASADLVTMPDGRVAARATVNGRPSLLLVDTGASFSLVTDSIANVLQLKRRPLPNGLFFQFYGGALVTQTVKVEQFALGGRAGIGWDFPVMPDGVLSYDLSGLVGANLLASYDTDIDYLNEKMNLFLPDHCPGQVVYWTQAPYARVPFDLDGQKHITVEVLLDGKPVKATIDTGAASSAMTIERAASLFGITTTDPKLRTLKDGEYRYPFQTLAFDGVSVQNPDIYLVPRKDISRFAPELLLGASILRQLHVYIAYKEGALYLTPAEAK